MKRLIRRLFLWRPPTVTVSVRVDPSTLGVSAAAAPQALDRLGRAASIAALPRYALWRVADTENHAARKAAYAALTRESDAGPDTSERAVESARELLAAVLVRPGNELGSLSQPLHPIDGQ
jgi:hypothetical protein